MSTLAAFLLARVEEDEETAKAAVRPEHMHPYGDRALPAVSPEQVPDEVRGYLGGAWGEHFARWDPARVLAECAAKRAILAVHCPPEPGSSLARTFSAAHCTGCGYSGPCDDPNVEHVDQCPTLRAIAQPYTSHPDFRPEWATKLATKD